jgi:hypothetical protein
MGDALHIALSIAPGPSGETERELRIAGPVRWRDVFGGIAS